MRTTDILLRPIAALALAFSAHALVSAQTPSPAPPAPAAPAASAPEPAADPVLTAQFDWAAVTPKMFGTASPAQRGRALLLADLAVFNALNALNVVGPRYKAYATPGPALEAAPQAAIAAAVRTVLSTVPGIDGVALDKTYADQMAKVKDAAARANARVWGGIHHRSAVEAGYALGRRVVDEMLRTQLTALP